MALLSGSTVADELYFIHTDHLETPTVMTDENQSVVWQGEREPFGDTQETVNAVALPLRFPGQYFDEETGLHYNLMRDYDPRLGRYLQSDPIGLGGGINSYGYANQNPLSYVDPNGELAVPVLFGLVNGFVAATAARASGCDERGVALAFAKGFVIGAVGGVFAKVTRAGDGVRGLLTGTVSSSSTLGAVIATILSTGVGTLDGAAEAIGRDGCGDCGHN